MSRFAAIDPGALPPLDVLKALDFEDELAALKDRLLRRAESHGLDLSDVIHLESDPLHVICEVLAARIVKLQAEANDQIRALTLADAIGAELDHIAATYYGITRLVVTPADAQAVPPVAAVLEADADFRARIALAPEAFTTAGTAGAYAFHILELDGRRDIADVAVFSAHDGARWSGGLFSDAFVAGLAPRPGPRRCDGQPVEPGEVLICIEAVRDYGAVDQALLDRACKAIDPVRPLCAWTRIEPAKPVEYAIEATLHVRPGTDAAAVRAAAREAALRHRDQRRRIGMRVQPFGLAAAMTVVGVEEIDLKQPGGDINPGPRGFADCLSDPVIEVKTLSSGWRS